MDPEGRDYVESGSWNLLGRDTHWVQNGRWECAGGPKRTMRPILQFDFLSAA
jgi:hypothetical protein